MIDGIGLRAGWGAALSGLAVAAVVATMLTAAAVTAHDTTTAAAWGAVAVLAVGALTGSQTAVGLAAFPVVAATAVGLTGPVGRAWGTALIVGLGWYVATELVWASIEARGEAVATPAVARRRAEEVVAVVATAAVTGLVAVGLASLAPTRSLMVKVVVAAALVAAMLEVARRVRTRVGGGADRGARRAGPGSGSRAMHGG